MDCMKLTSAELQILLNAGWERLAGPFDTRDECLEVCTGGLTGTGTGTGEGNGGGGPVVTTCCPAGLPFDLFVSGGDLGNVSLTHNAVTGFWEGTTGATAFCSPTTYVRFYCTTGTTVCDGAFGAGLVLQHSCDGVIWVVHARTSCNCAGPIIWSDGANNVTA